MLPWSSDKAKRPDWSICTAEILATGESIDEGKSLAITTSELFNIFVLVIVALDSFFETVRIVSQKSSLGPPGKEFHVLL